MSRALRVCQDSKRTAVPATISRRSPRDERQGFGTGALPHGGTGQRCADRPFDPHPVGEDEAPGATIALAVAKAAGSIVLAEGGATEHHDFGGQERRTGREADLDVPAQPRAVE